MSTVDQSTQEVIDEIVRMSHGDIDRVRELVDLHPGLTHATGAHGIPVLFFAAMAGHIGIAELLRRHGASVNAGEGGNMALHAAAAFGRPQMAEWLIANGAKIDVPSYNGQTPLALAIDRGHNNVAELLRQHGGKDQS